MIVIKNADQFFELQKQFQKIPYTQSLGWYNYTLSKNKDVIFFVDSDKECKIACWGIEYHVPFTKKKMLRIEGECYDQHIDEQRIADFYTKISSLHHEAVEIDSNTSYDIRLEIGLRLAGFKRPLGLFSCPLTIEIDLTKDFQYNRNWKENIRKAIKNELYFQEVSEVNQKTTVLISEMYLEMADLKGMHSSLDSQSIEALLNSDDIRTFIVYDRENNPLAVNIVHVNYPFSSLIYAINSLKAREFGGSQFLISSVFSLLNSENFKLLDFCRIPPSNHGTNGIYRFKSGCAGAKIQYNGEWASYKNPYMEGLIYLYKKIIRKNQRY